MAQVSDAVANPADLADLAVGEEHTAYDHDDGAHNDDDAHNDGSRGEGSQVDGSDGDDSQYSEGASYIRSIEESPDIPISKRLAALTQKQRFAECGTVYCYELSSEHNSIRLVHQLGLEMLREQSDTLGQFWDAEGVAAGISLRLVIVEDISRDLIDIIGSALELDPLFFVQHLTSSGINKAARGCGTGDLFPDPFLHGNLNIFSVRWCRPVKRVFKSRKSQRQKLSLITSRLVDTAETEKLLGPLPASDDLQALEEDQFSNKSTNTFRDSWYLGKPIEFVESTKDRGNAKCSIKVPTAWEERVTIHGQRRNNMEFVIMLTDPLPHITEFKTPKTGSEGQTPRVPIVPYEQISARWTYDRQWTSGSTSWSYPKRPRTAHVDMINWMTNQCFNDVDSLWDGYGHLAMTSPFQALFMIVYLDTMVLADLLDTTLREIRLASVNESELRRSIGMWRVMLTHAQVQLPNLRNAITEFGKGSSPALFPRLWNKYAVVRERLASLIAKTEETQSALRAEMSFLESRKQLQASEAVTKLTELAFIFVPLSFVASTFSMQIQELQSPPPLTAFILASFLAICLAYMIRLIISSIAFQGVSRTITEGARRVNGVPPDQPVPTRAYARFFLWCAIFCMTSFEMVLATCLGAVIWLWASRGQLDTSFKAFITVSVLTLTCVIYYAVCVSSTLTNRNVAYLAAHMFLSPRLRNQILNGGDSNGSGSLRST